MKKQHPFSVTSRPTTAKKKSPTQNTLVNGMKRMTVDTKEFDPNS